MTSEDLMRLASISERSPESTASLKTLVVNRRNYIREEKTSYTFKY